MGQGHLAYITPVNLPEGGAPGSPSHPIAGFPSHPITLPPLPPGVPAHPIALPPTGEAPDHPIFIPIYPDQGLPGTPPAPDQGLPPVSGGGAPSHPIAPGSGSPSHPIALPPGMPPGTVWPPLNPGDGVQGPGWLLVLVVGADGKYKAKWISLGPSVSPTPPVATPK
jgi:hypothetical protein